MTTDPKQLSPNKQALLRIRELKQQLAAAQQGTDEPIAIVSMACRFPRRASTPELFWQSLLEKSDEVSEIPDDRWDLEAFFDEDPEVPGRMYARQGVFLDQIDQMDPEFFGISPREATWVDPQQRLLMEVGWEALERAGWTPDRIGDHTGVFVGWMHNDYQNEASDSFLNLNPYIATGAAGSFLCGRLAYYLGLQGPSVAVDTACSSSLVALHLAVQSLQRRDCDRALVGGVNAICSPTTNILTCKLKALSPSGHSRAFDAAADGYLRGEGCGVVTLRRLSDAERDGDPILGIVRGSAVGHNGFSSGLTAPNPKAQEKVIRQALDRAGLSPDDVQYLEAHGTGTELGDPIEMQAAAAALSGNRTRQNPLLVGSVKTNIGHLEAAAGMAGLIKVLLSMENNAIPGQLNFEQPNPHIPWDQLPVQVLTDPCEWPDPDRKIAGVSAFGMSGTNAHVVLESPRRSARRLPAAIATDGPELITLSAKQEEALWELADRYAAAIANDPALELAEIRHTTNLGRSHFEHRAAMVTESCDDLTEQLKQVARGGTSSDAFAHHHRRPPRVAWQFTGQGSQYVGMAGQLFEWSPVFRQAIEQCDRQLREIRQQSLIEVMWHDEQALNSTHWTQPAIFAVQMGLARLMEHCGLRPSAVLGHSVGQYAAACVAGILSWEEGLNLIAERGRLIGELPSGGGMLAVFAPIDLVEDAVAGHPQVSLAASNGTHNVVSGPIEAITPLADQFESRGIRTKSLVTSHGFHSSLMDPALQPFQKYANQVQFRPPQIPFICNVTGQLIAADRQLDGEYWTGHIRQAVRYAESVETLNGLGCDVLLELGPHAVLTRMATANWSGNSDALIHSLDREDSDPRSLLRAIGRLYVHGANPDFSSLQDGHGSRIAPLPTYPFQRRRFWGPDKPRAFHAEFHTAHPLLGGQVSLAGVANESRYEGFIEPDSPSWMPDHEVMGNVVLPGAAYVEMAIAASEGAAIREIVFEQPLQTTGRTALQTVIRQSDNGEKSIEVFSSAANSRQWTRNFVGKIGGELSSPDNVDRSQVEAACPVTAEPEDFYRRMQTLGLNYGPKFQTIQSMRYSETDVLTRLQTDGDVRGFVIPPPLLDGAFHSLAAGLLNDDDGHLFLPVGMERVECFRPVESAVWCHARWTEPEGKTRTAEIVLFDDSGAVVAAIRGFKVQQVSLAALRNMSGAGAERLIHELNWQSIRLPASTVGPTKWLIIQQASDEANPAAKLSQRLDSIGHQATVLRLEGDGGLQAGDEYSMGGRSPENWARLLDALAREEESHPLDGIVWLIPGHDTDAVETTELMCTAILNLFHGLLDRGMRKLKCGIQWVTRNAIAIDSEESVDPRQTQYWGLGRVLGAEQPELRCRLIDVARDEDSWSDVVEIMLTETRDNQLLIRKGQFLVPRMEPVKVNPRDVRRFEADPERCYLVTGGLGMLGREVAHWLADRGAGQLVLVSRRAPEPATQQYLDSIECEVVIHQADMTSPADVTRLFERFGKDLKPLAGVVHAAGVLDDALIESQTWQRFEKVLAPKITAAQLLHEFTRSLELDLFVLYSSAASVLGSPGQSNYATGNAYLDGLAWHRRAAGLPAISINWGPWTAGMADDERIIKRLALQGITPLSIDEAHAAMEMMLSTGATQGTVMDVDWRRMRTGPGGETPAILERIAGSRRQSRQPDSALVGKLKQLKGAARRELLVNTIQQTLQAILSTPDVPETDRPLIEMGLDSLMAVEFGTELQQMLGDQFAVGPTMLFDHPTIDAITDHVLELLDETTSSHADSASQPTQTKPAAQAMERDDIAIIGMSCRFPGAENVDQFWQNLLDGVDSVREIPDDRWDIDRFYSEDRAPGKMYTREGGFLESIADFDAHFFGISDQEACWIDPQHRMLLENSYLALEDAGIAPQPLADPNVGVFMGIMGQDYAFLPSLDDSDVIHGFQGAGLSHSAGVGRISYVFGFEGPSVAVDTASSSSLVALLQAVGSLQDGHCNLALAGGVNAILAPVNSLLMSKAGLLAPDGRCKSFSAEADGFGRGEGCGVVVLKRLSDARRDGDRIMAVVRGGAVVHNGFSGGITSPSGKAQSRVIDLAVKDARIAPSQVQYLEAHGTGTEFGDPMELGAATSVYSRGRQPDQPLLVGSVKANISHLEAAGGVSGLIKTVLAIHHGLIPRQIHLEQPSPHIPWQRMPVRMVAENTKWPEADQRMAGITALGLVGTNAHVILSSETSRSESDAPPTNEREARLLPLSARNPQALAELADRYASFLQQHDEISVDDICFTAGAGRRHFEHRIAIPFKTRNEAVDRLLQINRAANINTTPVGRTPKLGWLLPEGASDSTKRLGELLKTEPLVGQVIGEMDSHLADHLAANGSPPFSIRHVIESGDETGDDHDSLLLTYALQACLARLWQSWGIEPDAVFGWGAGQIAAYCVAGGLCFNDAAILVYERQRLGRAPMKEDLDRFETMADQFNFYPPNLPFVCGATGDVVPVHRSLGGSFWREHVDTECQVADSLAAFKGLGCESVLQFGDTTEPLASALGEMPAERIDCLPGTPDETVSFSLLTAAGKLYERGLNPDFHGIHQHWTRQRISLPSYPFQKKRYWITEISKFMDPSERMEQTTIS